MNSFRLVYALLSAILFSVLITFVVNFRNSQEKFVNSIVKAIIVALVVIPVYALLFFAMNEMQAMIIISVYYIGTDWLAYFVFRFALQYTVLEKHPKRYVWIYITVALIDSISLLVNIFTHHSFYLHYACTSYNFMYWSVNFTPLHYIHLGFCYIMVINSFAALFSAAVHAPCYYKRKFWSVFIAYGIIIVANMVCYSYDTPVDISIILYGILAAYCTYFSAFKAPNQMLIQILHTINETIDDGIIYFNDDDKCIYINPYAKRLVKDGERISTKVCEEIFRKELNARQKDFDEHAFRKEHLFYKGKPKVYEVEFKKLYFSNTIVGSYVKFTDITENELLIEKQKYIAEHDALTGLYNRKKFFEECNKLIKENPYSERYMIASNIKDFKFINEIFGREAGNAILKKQAELMRTYCSVHSDDIYGRIGEDKFAIFMNAKDFNVSVFEESILTLRNFIKGSRYSLRVIFGVCPQTNTVENSQVLYDKAHLANKSISSNYQRFYNFYNSELMEQILVRKNITADFADGIRKNQFKVYLQPVFYNNGKNCNGAEAFVYWDHPKLGLQNPEYFIDVLEESALIHVLDTYVLEHCIRTLKFWQDNGLNDYKIMVNISTKNIYYMDICSTIKELLDKYEVNPGNLCLEFKETLFTSDFVIAKDLFKKLRKLGVKTGLDNFGRGYSSLNLLKDVKTDFLKMDMLFLSETENSERSVLILKFIASLARSLEMEVISQGVESKEQVEILNQLGCEYMQGYYFSKPVLIEEFNEKFMK